MLKNGSNGRSTLQLETLELLPHIMEGAIRKCPYTAYVFSETLSSHPLHRVHWAATGNSWTDAGQVTIY
jgi:hypothetical protein